MSGTTQPNWLNQSAFVSLQIAAVQAAASAPIDASQGSVTLALTQATTGAALWLQGEVATVLGLTRAATSNGTDLDSWMADWFFTRLPAVAATGQVTFTRFQNTQQVVVLPGSAVSTGPGGQQYVVTTDTTNQAWSTANGGYLLAINGVSSITVPIAAVTPGAAGNCLPNTITSFVAPIIGIDQVTNPAALTNGINAQSDASFRAAFAGYLASRRQGTTQAIAFAVQQLGQNVVVNVVENQDFGGAFDPGMVSVIVDDGSGHPPQSLISAANVAVNGARAAGVRYGVFPPAVVLANIVAGITSINNGLHAIDIIAAEAALDTYINSLAIGASLSWSRLFQLIFDSSANISDITGLTLNNLTLDLPANPFQVIKTGTINLS